MTKKGINKEIQKRANRKFAPPRPLSPPRGGGAQDTDFNKGFTKGMFTKFLPTFSGKCKVLNLSCLVFPGGPEGFRELREAGRNHFHLS